VLNSADNDAQRAEFETALEYFRYFDADDSGAIRCGIAGVVFCVLYTAWT
jgi:hypothetical protein